MDIQSEYFFIHFKLFIVGEPLGYKDRGSIISVRDKNLI
jgi:hypothetical protein